MGEQGITRRIRMKASLVILPIDDYSGRFIQDSSVRIYIENEKAPIRKSDGCRVFLNLFRESVVVHCDSPIYHSVEKKIELKDTDHITIVKIRMMPNQSYPLPQQATCVTGKGKPGETVELYNISDGGNFRILGPYKKRGEDADCIQIYNPSGIELGGKRLHIQNKDLSQSEYFTIIDEEENHTYRMDAPLQYDYKKVGTLIQPVYETRVDKNGEFFIPLPDRMQAQSKWLLCYPMRDCSQEIVLQEGIWNRIKSV